VTIAHGLLLAQREQHAEQAGAPLPGRQRARVLVAERHEPEAVAAPRRGVAHGERSTLGDVGLAALGGAERHRRRGVEHEPGHEGALGEVDPHVRRAGARGHVPVDLAHVVLDRLVGPDLRELAAPAEHRRAVIARQQPVDAAGDREIDGAQQRLRHRPRAGSRRGLAPAEEPLDHAARPERSSCGTGTAATTSSRMLSALRCSASAS
jgi:hypothetical protein